MSRDFIDLLVIFLAFTGGIAISVVDNPLTGAFLLVGVMSVWELTKKFALPQEQAERA